MLSPWADGHSLYLSSPASLDNDKTFKYFRPLFDCTIKYSVYYNIFFKYSDLISYKNAKKLCEKWYFLEKGADCILLLVFSSKTLDRPQLLFSNSHWTFEDSQGTLTTRIVEEMDPFFYSLSLTHARTHSHALLWALSHSNAVARVDTHKDGKR